MEIDLQYYQHRAIAFSPPLNFKEVDEALNRLKHTSAKIEAQMNALHQVLLGIDKDLARLEHDLITLKQTPSA